MRVTVFDYGAGNLHSVVTAIAGRGVNVAIEPDPIRCLDTDVLLLPGVGAFPEAAARLAPGRDVVRRAISDGLPVVGICLGMQLLFDSSEEGPGEGLGLIAGSVTRVAARRVPHMGWNTLDDGRDPLLEGAPIAAAYFANGFACRPDDPSTVTAWTTHDGDRFPAMVRTRSAIGMQFHPEKSSAAGVRLLKAALKECVR